MIRYGVVGLFVCLFIQFLAVDVMAQDKFGALKCICIDPGHGGKDPGAVGAKSYEKNLVLAISLKLGQLIKENYPHIKVVYTRDTDVFVGLHERGKIANSNKADLFISVHINSIASKSPHGMSTYVLGLHATEENLRVAMKENSVIKYEKDYTVKYDGFDPNRAESYIIFSMMQNLYIEKSLLLAGFAQEQMIRNTQRHNRGVLQAGYIVLKDAAMPSMLVEAGFISNPNEERYLNTVEAQNKIAQSIFNAIKEYKSVVEKNSGVLNKSGEQKEKAPTIAPIGTNDFYYAVQIASAKQKITNHTSFSDIEEEILEVLIGERYRYCIGKTSDYNEVKTNLARIRERVKDCFVIAVHQGDIISISEAKAIESKLK